MAALCGLLCLCAGNNSSAAETSVLVAPRNADSQATTVFKRPTTAAAAATKRKNDDAAPLEWRVRRPKTEPSAAAARLGEQDAADRVVFKNPAAKKPTVALAQYEAEPTAESSGPILRAANESVLLPAPSANRSAPAGAKAPRRLTAADARSTRPVSQAPDEDITTHGSRAAEPMRDAPGDAPAGPANPRRYAEDLPSESVTPPETADSIFGDRPSPTTPAPTTPAPATPAPTTPAPAESPAAPAETPPAATPPSDIAPPARLPMPEESPLPETPADLSEAEKRDAEIRSFLFGKRDIEVGEAVGELGDCDKTNKEVLGKRVVDISIDISPKASDVQSAWSYDRPWKDVTGKTLFVGRPLSVDATSREATFLLADGTKRRVKLRDLSRDEQGYFLAIYPLPIECPLIDETFLARSWTPSTYVWKASAACHKPLYFEDVHLERYGHSVSPILQPFASSAHFFGTLPILPYKMGVHPPTECIYTLGYYRPGNCAPWLLDPIPLSARGALFEAGAWVGGVVVIP